jgi:pimeloyl-ACP methyl ester carboxylesterase
VKKTMIMIHGMWGGPWVWENYRQKFEADGYYCNAITLPFHGMNSGEIPNRDLGTTSLLDYAMMIEDETRKLDSKPVMIGHSMGGLLAQMLGARGLAKALVLISPAAPAGILSVTPSVIRSFGNILSSWGFWRKPVRQTFAEAVYSTLHLLPPKEQDQVYNRFVDESGRTVFEMGFWMLDRRGASRVDTSKVNCPVLLLAGKEDRMTPLSVVRKVARKYRRVVTYQEYDHHAHWMLGEPGWEEVAGFILNWLGNLQPENQ